MNPLEWISDALSAWSRRPSISISVRFYKTGGEASVAKDKEKQMLKHSEINWARFISLGKQLVNKPYIFGAETNLKDPDPEHIKALDCSELVEWLFAQVAPTINVPDGSYNQFKVSTQVVGDLKIGDLGFKWHPENSQVHHVAVWLEDTVLEAKGHAWGVILTPRADFEKSPDFAMWRRLNGIQDA